jgi:hypothetical protein
MILKRFLFPIFILLIFSCKKNSDYDIAFNTINYDEAIKKASEYLENQKENDKSFNSMIKNINNFRISNK